MEAVTDISGVGPQIPILRASSGYNVPQAQLQIGLGQRNESSEGLRAEDLSRREVRSLADAFGEAIAWINRAIRYEIDESVDRLVTKIVDRETNEVVRQIPSEETLRAIRRMREFIGLLLDIQA